MSTNVSKNPKQKNSTSVRPVKVALLHAGRQTDRGTDGRTNTRKLIVALRNCFANCPKNYDGAPSKIL